MVQPVWTGLFMGTPPGRSGHISVPYEKYMLVWGGYRENYPGLENTYFSGAEIWIFSCTTENWYLKINTETEYPSGMSGSAAVVINDALYVFGGYGYNGHGCTNRLFRLDLMSFRWEQMEPSGITPIPGDKMVGWNYNNKFYVFGGFGNAESNLYKFKIIYHDLSWRGWTNQFIMYDPKKNHWSSPTFTGKIPSPRAAHAAAVIKEKVYIFGGRLEMRRLNDLHCLNMDTMRWSGEISVKGPVPIGRSWHSLTALNDQFLILYGGFSQENVPLSDCWMFDTKAQLWKQIELPFRKPRLWHCACSSIFNEVLIYGGCTSNILDSNRVPAQATDVVVIRIAPKSLYRLCVDKLLEVPKSYLLWHCLPRSIQSQLFLRVGSHHSRNLDGS